MARSKQRSEPAVFIVNPQAGGGKSERQLKELLAEIQAIYGNAKIVFTERKLHATEIGWVFRRKPHECHVRLEALDRRIRIENEHVEAGVQIELADQTNGRPILLRPGPTT